MKLFAKKKEPIQLSDHFTYGRLMRFVIPSIIMMIFTSVYGVVDGLFVSNYVGKTPFAAVNLIMPFLMVFGGVGFMIGTGGTAIVSRTLGEGDKKRANEIFSLLLITSIVLGVGISVIAIIFLRPISILLGAEGEMIDYCVRYGRIIMAGQTFFMLQNLFQSFLVTAERPKLGLYVTIAAGVTNMIGDWLLVGVFRLGVEGAATATVLSQAVGGLIPFFYFVFPNSSQLRLTKTHFDGHALAATFTNGSSELMSNISMSVVGMMYNFQLLRFAGEDGVAAYGVIMYVGFIFVSVFIGYAIGSAPIIGYNYGADNHVEMKNIFKKSIVFNLTSGVFMTVSAILLSGLLADVFVGYDTALRDMTRHGFMVYAFSYLLCGFSIFGSSMFTALSNGLISALISFLRTLVFQTAMVFILPIFWQLEGVWLSVVAAELFSGMITLFFILKMRSKYQYF